MGRHYIKNAVYHISMVTKFRYPYFKENIFCNILIDVFEEAAIIKTFDIIAYKVNQEHIHLTIKVGNSFNISQIMHSIRRNAAININKIIFSNDQPNPYAHLKYDEKTLQYLKMYHRKNNFTKSSISPKFQWKKRFDDQIVLSLKQLQININYIRNQSAHHELTENKFLFVTDKLPMNINFKY